MNQTTTDPIEEAITQIERAITGVMQQISSAAERRDLNAVVPLSKKAAELEATKNRLMAFSKVLQPEDMTTQNPGVRREFFIGISPGMLNQNLLTLTGPMQRGETRVGEKFRIEALPSGDRFETELLASGNKLRERGKIAKFYRDAGVQPGDVVVLSEIIHGQWQLKKRT